MSRIAFFLPSLRAGGVGRMTTILANEMSRRGHHVDVVLMKAEGEHLSQLSSQVNVIDLKSRRMALSVGPLAAYMRSGRPDAVISALRHANIVAYLARLVSQSRTRLVVSERNNITDDGTLAAVGIKGRVIKLLIRLIYRKCDGIVAVSDGVANDLVHYAGVGRDRVTTIYNPAYDRVTIERRLSEAADLGEVRRPLFVAVGRLEPQKDYPTLLEAFALVRAQIDSSLVIIGPGSRLAELTALAKELGLTADVEFLGYLENPYVWMRAADVFVLSSQWEGLANVLIEALACGARVVSTDCRSGPREVLEDGKWGRLVPVGRPELLADAMLMSLRDERHVDYSPGLRRFEVDNAAASYLNLCGLPLYGQSQQSVSAHG